MKNGILSCFLLVSMCFSTAVLAEQSPQDMVKSVSEKTIAKLKQDKALIAKEPERLYELIKEYVLPHFDFERMSKWVLGKYWRQATPQEQKRFIEEFRTLLVRTYATSLADFAEQNIKFLPFHDDLASGEVTIKSEVEQPGSFPVPINYRLHKIADGWKVFDVTIDDISLISNYRTSFSREIRTAGISGLIDQLAAKNKKAMQ
ncbi:MAG: ABC transporter substrate-binding protein [Gammaproteobacteria bacterium]|nr:ABC transporter substrate-binding protein [Gammaproteobacteria bacterium]